MDNTEELQKQQLENQQPAEPQPQKEPTPAPSNEAEVAETQAAQPVETEENAAPATGGGEEPEGTAQEEIPAQEKMIPQSEVDRIIQARIAKVKAKAAEEAKAAAREEFIGHYGVGSDAELDEMFGNGQKYKVLSDEYGNSQKELEAVKAENALLKSGVREEKFTDVLAVLAFNGQPVTMESIAAAADTHPEWFGDVTAPGTAATDPGISGEAATPVPTVKPSVIKAVGSGPSTPAQEKSEKELAFEQMGL